jgi:hypothetical protein
MNHKKLIEVALPLAAVAVATHRVHYWCNGSAVEPLEA